MLVVDRANYPARFLAVGLLAFASLAATPAPSAAQPGSGALPPMAAAEKRSSPPKDAVEKRMALVVGNARYPTIPLNNPENDARVMAAALRRLGFEVNEHVNLGVRDFRKVLREFARRIQDQPGAAVLFYAGHGVQIDGRNYLLPVDINLRDEEEVKDEAVDIDELFLSKIDRAKTEVRIIILDACRDNPFRKTRNIRSAGGLAEMNARGTLIAFSSAPGAAAEDGPAGTNSAYTRHLAKEMLIEGQEVEQMFKNVRIDVLKDTNQRQLPWVNTSLTASFSFNPSRGPGKEELARQEEVRRLHAMLDRREQEQRKLEEEVKRLNKQIEEPKATAPEPALSPVKQATAPPPTPAPVAPTPTGALTSDATYGRAKQSSAEAPGSPPGGPRQAAAKAREPTAATAGAAAKESSELKTASRKPAAPVVQAPKKSESAPAVERPLTVSKALSERCVAALIRAQLGEPISDEDKEYLRKECR